MAQTPIQKDVVHTMIELEKIARRIRLKALTAIHKAGSGHPGASLSAADILTALYFHNMDITDDRFILSKGHAAPALYATFNELGWISEEVLMSLRQIDSPCQGHPDRKALTCINAGTGALGQGLSIAIGYAEAFRLKGHNDHVYCLLGDGECQEGQVWEAAMYAGTRQLTNLCAIIDSNKFQNENSCAKTLDMGNIGDKWKAFGWHVREGDGHDFNFLKSALDIGRNVTFKPTLVVANTIKGKGVSFMENDNRWHGQVIGDLDYKFIKEELGDIN
jgi:transketolase